MIPRIFFSFLFLVLFIPPLKAAHVEKFIIFPEYLFTDEDLGVNFAVKVVPQGSENPKTITLMEVDETRGNIKYRWPLNDEGTHGDKKAADGVYSREIQFKERKPKQIVFYVLEENADLKGPPTGNVGLPSISAAQREVLEIRAHPTFTEIIKNAFHKIWEKFH